MVISNETKEVSSMDVYNEEYIETSIDDDSLSAAECGFMRGYLAAV